MKNLILLIAVCFTFASTAFAQATKDSVVLNAKGFGVAKIKTSAVCDMCKETLEKAMAYEKGVKASSLDVDSKILTVTFDTKKTSLATIRKAVTLAGYDADGIMANEKAYQGLHACCKKDAQH